MKFHSRIAAICGSSLTNTAGEGGAMRSIYFILLVFLLTAPVSAGYSYVTMFNMSAAAPLTNHQFDITISNATGNSGAGIIYTDGATRPDWADINFTDSTGTAIPFFIRAGTETTTGVGVTFSTSVNAGSTTRIKMYYGDPTQSTSLSNGYTTFPFFEGCDSINTTAWYINNTPTSSGGICSMVSPDGTITGMMSKEAVSLIPGVAEFRLKTKHFQDSTYKETIYGRWTNSGNLMAATFSHSLSEYSRRFYQANTTGTTAGITSDVIGGWSADTYGIIKFISEPGAVGRYKINGANTRTIDGRNPPANGRIWFQATTAAGSEIDVDWLATRDYVATEPTTSNYITTPNIAVSGGDYSFIHLSDFHLSDRTTPAGLNTTLGEIETLKSQYNITAVFVTGDISSQTEGDFINYHDSVDGGYTTVPIYEVTGNHDRGSDGNTNTLWDTYVPNGANKHNYGFIYNNFVFYGLDWNGAVTDYFTTQINAGEETKMLAYLAGNSTKIPIIASHAYMMDDGSYYPVGASIKGDITRDSIVLCGHNLTAPNDPGFLRTSTNNGYTIVEDMTNYQSYTPQGVYLGGRLYTVHETTAGQNVDVSSVLFLPTAKVNETTSYFLSTSTDTTPPASITSLTNETTCNGINWTWTIPGDADYGGVMVYKNGVFVHNATGGTGSTWGGLDELTEYTISTHTYDTSGNVNQAWVNLTTTTTSCTTPTPTPTLTPTPTTVPFQAGFSSNVTCGNIPVGVAFTDTSSGTNITNWAWDFGDGNTSVLEDDTNQYSEVGLYTVRHYIDDGLGNYSWVNRTEAIQATPIWYKCNSEVVSGVMVANEMPVSLAVPIIAAAISLIAWRRKNRM